MTREQAKQIAISDYLGTQGIMPTKQQGNNLWYYSPFRSESEPSFKVNLARNEWYDFGLGKGGNIIALIMELHGTNDVATALRILFDKPIAANSFSFGKQDISSGFEDIKVRPLANPALLQYLSERSINLPFAEQFCNEVYFKTGGKPYFAVGFENRAGGLELRNKYFQGSTAPKDITVVGNGSASCCIFEGFIDFLSYLTLRKQKNLEPTKHDYIVLNSVANFSKAIPIISTYQSKQCYFDNDTAGRTAFAELQQKCGDNLTDQSVNYREHKDLNDYLCGKKLSFATTTKPIIKPYKMKR